MIRIEPLIGGTVSSLISLSYGAMLDIREKEIFDYCQSMGEVYLGYIDGEFVCCWGLIPPSFLSYQAYLWMWASPKLKEHQFVFIRQSQRQVEEMLKRFEIIVGHCKIGNASAVRWLKWLGASFESPEGTNLPFTIRRRADG